MKIVTVWLIGALGVGSACGGSSSRPPDDGDDVDAAAVDAPGLDVDGAVPPDGPPVDGVGDPDAEPPPANTPCQPSFTIGIDGDGIYQPTLGIDATGDAVALWRQGEYSGNDAMGAVHGGHLDAVTGWADVTRFEHGDGGYPTFAFDVAPSGSAFAAFQQDHYSDDHRIWTTRYVPGAGWTAVAVLPTDVAPHAFGSPDVAVDDSGDAIVVWHAEDGLHATRYGPGGWEADEQVAVGDIGDPEIAIGPGGVAIVSWTGAAGDTSALLARRYTPGVGWGEPVTLDLDAGSAQLGFDAAGDAIATWSRHVEPTQVWAARYIAGTGWSPPLRLDLADTRSDAPSLAVAPSGHAVIVWTEFVAIGDSSMPRVAAATYDPQTGWSDGALLQTENPAFGEDVAIDGDGDALAAWHEFEAGADTHVHARRFTPGVGWGDKFLLIEEVTRDPQLTMNVAGDAVVAWTTWTGNGHVLHGCAYH